MSRQLHVDAEIRMYHPRHSTFFNNIELLRFLFAWVFAAFCLNGVHYYHNETIEELYKTCFHMGGAILNMILSCVLGYLWGLAGVLLGCIIVPFLIRNVWKPYFLCTQVFKIVLSNYIWQWCFIFVLISVSMGIAYHILEFFSFPDPFESFFKWGLYAVMVFTVYSLFLFILMYVSLSSFRLFISRFVRLKPHILNYIALKFKQFNRIGL